MGAVGTVELDQWKEEMGRCHVGTSPVLSPLFCPKEQICVAGFLDRSRVDTSAELPALASKVRGETEA